MHGNAPVRESPRAARPKVKVKVKASAKPRTEARGTAPTKHKARAKAKQEARTGLKAKAKEVMLVSSCITAGHVQRDCPRNWDGAAYSMVDTGKYNIKPLPLLRGRWIAKVSTGILTAVLLVQ